MAHEKSVTIERGGRYYNIDTVGSDKGRVLGRKDGYPTEAAAVKAAKRRSRRYKQKGPPRPAKTVLEQ